MAKKKYKQNNPTPKVNEPGLTYQTAPDHSLKSNKTNNMSVDEYFDKVKKALDKRYEDLRRQNS